MNVRIVTDSTADIPPELAAQHDITVVPCTILFGEEELLDGVDITSERFFRRLVRERELPTTSQPSPGAFREVYERLAGEGATEIVSIHLSAKLSGTVESARQAARDVEGVSVTCIDSRQTSLGLGLGVLEACAAAERGERASRIRELVEDHFARTHTFILFDTLEYLRRGGRIGRGMEVVGSLLRVKPLAKIEDGEVTAFGRVRTRPKAIEALLERAAELRPFTAAAAMHATTPEDLDYIVDRLHGLEPEASILSGRITPVVGVHTGPGLLGFVVVQAPANPPSTNNEDSPSADP